MYLIYEVVQYNLTVYKLVRLILKLDLNRDTQCVNIFGGVKDVLIFNLFTNSYFFEVIISLLTLAR